jgi:hypothetical protein
LRHTLIRGRKLSPCHNPHYFYKMEKQRLDYLLYLIFRNWQYNFNLLMIMKRPAARTMILTALLFLFSFHGLFYQTADQDVIDLIKKADDIKGKKAGAVIILKEYNSILNDKRENTLVLKVIGKIYDDRALEDYSHITMQFNSYYEDAILDHARTIRSNGSIIEVIRMQCR